LNEHDGEGDGRGDGDGEGDGRGEAVGRSVTVTAGRTIVVVTPGSGCTVIVTEGGCVNVSDTVGVGRMIVRDVWRAPPNASVSAAPITTAPKTTTLAIAHDDDVCACGPWLPAAAAGSSAASRSP
jgi:hypothetical protein